MLFVSGTENGDARHTQTLVDLALALGAMFSPSREGAANGGGGPSPSPSAAAADPFSNAASAASSAAAAAAAA